MSVENNGVQVPFIFDQYKPVSTPLNDIEQRIYSGDITVLLISKNHITSTTQDLQPLTHAQMMQCAKQSKIYRVK